MQRRNIKYQEKYYAEIIDFCGDEARYSKDLFYYSEHNDRYLKQCFYNLQEKYDRGIITDEEWNEILYPAYENDIIE